VIGFASFKPLIGNFPVAIESVRLEERTLVSIQPQPGQAIEDCLHVFDAKDEPPTVMTCVEPTEKCGADTA
jgi:hypothetical protein